MRDETATLAPVPGAEQVDTAVPAPDLSVLTEQPPAADKDKDKQEESKAASQAVTETTPAPVGLVVVLVVVAIVAAVLVAMWMVSPRMALLLGAGLIAVALLVGALVWAWRRFIRRAKTGKDDSGRRGDRGGPAPAGRGRSTTGGRPAGGRGRSTAGGAGKAPAGGKGGGLWPFGGGRSTAGGRSTSGKAPAGAKATPSGGRKAPAGTKPAGGDGAKKPTGDKGGRWPFSRTKPAPGSKTPGGGAKPTAGGDKKSPAGAKPAGGDGAKKKPGGDKGGRWPFSRTKPTPDGKAPGGGAKPTAGDGKGPGGGKAPGGGAKPAGDGAKKSRDRARKRGDDAKKPGGEAKPGDEAKKPGDKAVGGGGRAAKTAAGAAVLGLVGLVRAATKTKGDDGAKGDPAKGDSGKGGPAKGTRVRPEPGGHRPETVIDVDVDDITDAPGRKPSSPAGPAPLLGRFRARKAKDTDGPNATRVRPAPGGHQPGPVIDVDVHDITSAGRVPSSPAGPAPRPPRTAPIDPGSTAGSGWRDRPVPPPLRTTTDQQGAGPIPANSLGGHPMSTTTNADQDALRVANRYASMIEKAETLQTRAGACLDAAAQYRADARNNQESAENHRMSARTIRDPNVAHQHALAARDAEAEAAREILAARYYDAQAEQYQAQARAVAF